MIPPGSLSPYRLPQYIAPMSACGPLTTNLSLSITSLRICTPLLAPAPLSLTWNDNSKSLYFRVEQRKVLNEIPSGMVEPTMAPSTTFQCLVSPSQPASDLPSKNGAGSAADATVAGPPMAKRASRAERMVEVLSEVDMRSNRSPAGMRAVSH